MRTEHELAGFKDGAARQRHVDGHLVAIEVGVERETDERVYLDRAAVHENGVEGLDSQPVQGRRAVQHNRTGLDDLFQDVPDLRTRPLGEPLGALDVVSVALEHELVHNERLEQFQRHSPGESTLVELEVRPDGDDRPSAVVHALAEQVLPEPALLPAKKVGQRLELVVVTAGNRPASTAVVDQGVDGLLEHSLLVANDDLRGLEVNQPLEAVVAVDDPAVQVVQVAGGEPSAVKLHHRAQFRGQHRQDGEDHPFGLVAALAERLHHAKRLDGLLSPLAGRGADDFLEIDLLGVEVHPLEDFKDRFGPHSVGEYLGVGGPKLTVLRLGQQITYFERLDLVDLRLVFRLQLRQVLFELGVDPG